MKSRHFLIPVLAAALSAGAALAQESPQVRPYGAWSSPLEPADLVAGARNFHEPAVDGDTLYFLESRPDEGGRQALMRRAPDGAITEIGAPGLNVRSRVHEYGGGALAAGRGAVYYTDYKDQSLYRLVPGAAPVLLAGREGIRYADCVEDARRGRVVCVQEDHTGAQVVNRLVGLSATVASAPVTLFEGSDFVAAPVLDADGRRLAFLSWDFPNMPWDDVRLHEATLDEAGGVVSVRTLNDGIHESVLAPLYGPGGLLHFISDRDNWWNLYRMEGGAARQLTRVTFELGRPAWQLNRALYDFLPDGRIAALSNDRGREGLVIVDPERGSVEPVSPDLAGTSALAVSGNRVFLVGDHADRPGGLFEYDVSAGRLTLLREYQPEVLPRAYVSAAESVWFLTDCCETAQGFFYPPHNPGFRAPEGEKPPLIVTLHGGPTSHTRPELDLRVQFWTTRGFAVYDINHRGSTGFGRRFRHSLYGHWGSKDVEDAVRGAQQLADEGRVDPARLLIRGGSAGGFTVLAAHAFHDVFAAGAVYYGISDMEALAQGTHKFESRYLDQLVGPYPQQKEKYRAISPIHHLEGFHRPLILFLGMDDEVVPPAQSEAIARALKEKGVPVAYLPFPGEGHGFRDARNIIRTYEAELYFYGRVLGFTPADTLAPVTIENLDPPGAGVPPPR